MSQLFSQRSRHSTWRKLWLLLAESESELGIDTITPEALEQMRTHLEVSDTDFEVARIEEKRRRHDVMAHVHAFGAVAPAAAGIIHYGVSIRGSFFGAFSPHYQCRDQTFTSQERRKISCLKFQADIAFLIGYQLLRH